MVERPLRELRHLLVCPVCKGRLEFSPGLISCASCGLRFPQSVSDHFDLLPHHLLKNEREQWEERQQEMEEWYRGLIADPAVANDSFVADYGPYAPLLVTLSGDILDVGGGIGIVRDYLPRGAEYTVVEPSLDWLGVEWSSLAGRFPSLETKPRFVRGIGEYLPFPARSFDAVLAFWSLNHVDDPETVFGEVHRVLRPGGRFLIVLEDMAPAWGDIANGTFPASEVAPAGGHPGMENPAHPGGLEWPLQSDHIRIRESDIRTWISQRFEVAWRGWINQYLTFEFEKTEPWQRARTGVEDAEAQHAQERICVLQNERSDFVRQLQALERRLGFWRDRRGRELLDELRAHVRDRKWTQAIRSALMLTRYPRTFAFACRKLYERTEKRFKASLGGHEARVAKRGEEIQHERRREERSNTP